ncbi:MAG: Rieske (2Fe-2S) protein [Thermodesulfobacteriota bacterium]
MLVEVAKRGDIAPGGMKAVEAGGVEIILCRYEGKFYAFDRRCGHMSAPLDRGTLTGYILTCPMHCAQFDITSGEALSGPVPHDFGGEVPPEGMGKFFRRIGRLMSEIKTCNIKTYRVTADGDSIKVDL